MVVAAGICSRRLDLKTLYFSLRVQLCFAFPFTFHSATISWCPKNSSRFNPNSEGVISSFCPRASRHSSSFSTAHWQFSSSCRIASQRAVTGVNVATVAAAITFNSFFLVGANLEEIGVHDFLPQDFMHILYSDLHVGPA